MMKVGVVREIKPGEGRVALMPEGVRDLAREGVSVFVERGAGRLSGFADEDYARAGARILDAAAQVYAAADLIVKVKEILPPELPFIRPEHVIFTFHHSKMFNEMTRKFLATGCTGIAYEEIVLADGTRPLLRPMSEIAGKVGFIKAIEYLQGIRGGSGFLPMAIEGAAPLVVVVLGGGVAGTGAAQVALALGNVCHVVEKDPVRRSALAAALPGARVHDSAPETLGRLVREADVLINTATVGSYSTVHLVTREHLRTMKRSAIIVDVSCDIAGGVETCRLTTHDDPVYEAEGIRHYCVDNIPAAVPATSTRALCPKTFPYVRRLAVAGLAEALRSESTLARAVDFRAGRITRPALADALGLPCANVLDLLS